MSEFYFDYKMSIVHDGLGIKESGLPKLYVERDYFSKTVHYVLYLTFPQWGVDKKRETLAFDHACLSYDDWGIDTLVFDERADVAEDIREKVEKQNEIIHYDEYVKEYRYVISNSEWKDFSGVGVLTLTKEGSELQTVIYVAVNFVMKNKIQYEIHRGKLFFTSRNSQEQMKVRLYYSDTHFPCLTADKNSNNYEEINLDFSRGERFVYDFDDDIGVFLHVAFDPKDEITQRYNLLECVGNDRAYKGMKLYDRPEVRPFCPYCHEEIEVDEEYKLKYKNGGVACDGGQIYDGSTPVKLCKNARNKKPAQHVGYCADDFGSFNKRVKKPTKNETFDRLFPDKFLEKKNFKILVIGSKGSGKTTFLSRLFTITGNGEQTEFTAKMLTNAVGKKNSSPLSVAPFDLKKMEVLDDCLAVGVSPWHKDKETKFYAKYSMGFGKGGYVMPTKKYVETDGDKTELTIKYPFPLSVNDDAYVYFYDIAGEDAEQSGEILRRLTDTGAVGVLYLVDGDVNEKGNDSVNKRLVDRLASNPNIPVAVVLTKFDKLEEEFDENCHCLRGDAYDMLSKEYVGSELERNVNLASEEIKSYLTVKRINPEFDEETNVKYFGVSAFSTSDALDYEMVGDKSVCYLTHQCSAKRMELPVIWLLRQFGCII